MDLWMKTKTYRKGSTEFKTGWMIIKLFEKMYKAFMFEDDFGGRVEFIRSSQRDKHPGRRQLYASL